MDIEIVLQRYYRPYQSFEKHYGYSGTSRETNLSSVEIDLYISEETFLCSNHIPGTDRNDMLKKQVLRHIETSLGHGNVDKVTVLTFKRFLQAFKWIMETKLEENQSKVECRRFVFKKFDQLQKKKEEKKYREFGDQKNFN